jgi:hypothetical protein
VSCLGLDASAAITGESKSRGWWAFTLRGFTRKRDAKPSL